MVYGFLIVKFCERKYRTLPTVFGFSLPRGGLSFSHGNRRAGFIAENLKKAYQQTCFYYRLFLAEHDVDSAVSCLSFISVLRKFVFI